MHLGPIVPDILTRQLEHRLGLIWSRDYETYITDLQCRRFSRNLFQSYSTAPHRSVDIIDRTGFGGVFRYGYIGLDHVLITALVEHWRPKTHTFHMTYGEVKKEPLEAWILREFTCSETDDVLILHVRGFIFFLLGGHMLLDFSGNLVHVYYLNLLEDFEAISTYNWGSCAQLLRHIQQDLLAPLGAMWDGIVLPVEELSNPIDNYIRLYGDITRVYIGNLANHDTHTVRYQLAGVDRRMMEVDDMATGVIQGPPSSLTQITSFPKKVQTIIWRGARRLPGGGAHGGRAPAPPNIRRGGHAYPGCGERGEGSGGHGRGDLGSSDHVDPFDTLDLGMPSFSLGLMSPTQSHLPTS
ncbi:hypothetical protein M9H77_22060 [Catharanthus roseus]|uniref:Uncharacterized protein n=1 Tax=Catharanthus roseus TaxID=4058 RepID=A0ACC0AQL7_CATRO|nr:hypothetical protein M9H77_22060 [Catharanthus roseus]